MDESSFQQLLAAAYVVQQHNDGLRAKDPAHATSGVLSEIAEIQSLVRTGGIGLSGAARLTAERLQAISRADCVSLHLFRNESLECIAKSGVASADVADPDLAHLIISNPKLRAGNLFQSSDTQNDPRLSASSGQMRADSLIIAPIHRFEEFVGVLELRAHRPNAFQESDARAAQLMSGLVSGILERSERSQQRAAMPAAAEKSLAAISEPSDDTPTASAGVAHAETVPASEAEIRILSVKAPEVSVPEQVDEIFSGDILPDECRVCGRPFGAKEAFCGQCSMPRLAASPAEDLQSKWAAMLYMQRAQGAHQKSPAPTQPDSQPTAIPRQPETAAQNDRPLVGDAVHIWHVPDARTRPEIHHVRTEANPLKPVSPDKSLFFYEPQPCAHQALPEPAIAPGENTPPQDLLQSTWQTVWARMHRRHATIALGAVGCLLLFLVLAVWPSSKNSQLTWFQSLLVQLGIADVPAHPAVFTGNPSARVWVDVHTALYYCEGSSLYGKTPGGHFATQHEAQEDEFGPASGAVCP